MTPTQATTMAALLGGPAALGVAAVLGYARGVLSAPARDPGAGWRIVGIGVVLVVWFVVFLLLSTGDVVRYWTGGGSVAPEYVALTTAWVVGIGLLVVTLWNARRAARYLSESYRAGEWPRPVRFLRWLFRL
ncbi:hypothetical protein [Terrabacter sp. 2YAF2]|uniref:hypothetical protein n=1 Tax=Terrabacter sp. 2YAF2 TaxID=3233026 RepID=UPI003F97481F